MQIEILYFIYFIDYFKFQTFHYQNLLWKKIFKTIS